MLCFVALFAVRVVVFMFACLIGCCDWYLCLIVLYM